MIPAKPKIYHIVHVDRLSSIITDQHLWCDAENIIKTSDASRILELHLDTRERFSRVAELVEGFESPFGLELLSTVHWVMTKDNILSLEDVMRCTYAWNDRKRQFTQRQIALAVDVLSNKD